MTTRTHFASHIDIPLNYKQNTEAFHKRLQELYPCVDDVSKLPQAWSSESKAPSIGITNDNVGCYYRSNGHREDDEKSAAAVRADHYIPPSCLLYYFEVEINSRCRDGVISIGLTSNQASLTKPPGWTRESYGYHGDAGYIYNGDGRGNPYGPKFDLGDKIGCGYNLVEGKCFFTRNGLSLGNAFDDVPSNILLYPTIGLKTRGEIKANFGQEAFSYDIEQDQRSLRKNMTLSIANHPISEFSSWQNTLHKLVQSWLLQNSYPNTADAFTKSTKINCEENLQRVQQRKRIQQLVLNGRISDAIKLTNCLCPNLLQNNPNLLFALKCRQFIELIGGAENDYQPVFNYDNIENDALVKGIANSDRSSSDTNHPTTLNGCNGMMSGSNCQQQQQQTKTDSGQPQQQLASSSSLQELMDIDQPIGVSNSSSSSSNNTDVRNNHRNPQVSNINDQPEIDQAIKMETISGDQASSILVDSDLDLNEQKYAKLIQFGQELNDYQQKLDKLYGRNEINQKMLHDAIGLIAYVDPKNSCFGKLLNPSEREPISQLLNTSIVKAEMGDSYRLPMEEVMNHLRKLVRLNDSQGRWLIDRLYMDNYGQQPVD